VTFSILHPSARPEAWKATRDAWMSAAANKDNVEYVLCGDRRWGFSNENPVEGVSVFCLNEGRKCWVDSVNTAAKASSGDVLIVIADDIFPCEAWDAKLSERLDGWPSQWFAVEVSTGTPAEHERKILACPIISRALYEQWGYVLYPGFESMYADNDIFEHAEAMGVLIDARVIQFEHRHGLFEGKNFSELDPVYQHQNRLQAYEWGAKLLDLRRELNFGEPMKPKQVTPMKRKPRIAWLCPGEKFSEKFLGAAVELAWELGSSCSFVDFKTGYSSSVFHQRNGMLNSVKNSQPTPDYILWIDDDQILTVAQFRMLLEDLATHPEIDIVCGWTWRQLGEKDWVASCWALNSKTGEPMTYEELMRGDEPLRPISQSGFPAVLMRYSAVVKAGPNPFVPLLSEEFQDGMSGEDTAFFVRARAGGAKCFVDRRVLVPHLKLGVHEPAHVDVVEREKERAS